MEMPLKNGLHGEALVELEIEKAAEALKDVLERHPQCDISTAREYVERGELRPHAAMYLWRGPDIDAGESFKPTVPPPPRSPAERILASLKSALDPLPMLNPISRGIGLGRGTGTLAASFGVKLDETLGNTPFGNRPIDEVIAEGMPDPETSGIIPEMKETIDAVQALTPDWVQIQLPDMQGPFNIAHMILGDEVFIAPLTEPEKFERLMEIITDFFLAVHGNLSKWIEPGRFVNFPGNACRIAECSVNMISADTYMEHVFKHDRRIAESFGKVAIHPCSGPHVFKATLDNLPNVVYTEAGIMIKKMFAGSISVDEAMRQIGDRPMILGVGQELPEDFAEAERIVKGFFDLAKINPRMTFGFTGIFWRKGWEGRILDLHRRLDDYWTEKVYGASLGR